MLVFMFSLVLPAGLRGYAQAATISHSNWSLVYADSQEKTAEDGSAVNAFDGNSNTFWHTQWYGANPAVPHEIQINLGGLYDITGFRYLPRQDGITNGNIGRYEFYVSADGANWGSAVAVGNFNSSSTEKAVTFAAVTGRYIRLRALSEVSGNPWTCVAELNVEGSLSNPSSGVISRANWSLVYADSQEKTAEDGSAVNAFDGNSNTFWHTQWYGANPAVPHEIQINLGGLYDITGFRYLPRQDGITNGNIGRYEFYVSADGANWGSAVAVGNFNSSSTEKAVTFAAVTGRYIRLRALSEVSGNPWTCVAELNVLGSTPASYVRISSPAANALLSSTNITVTANAALASSYGSGWGVRFVLDGSAYYNDYSAPYQVMFTGASYAEHFIEAYIIDASGKRIDGTYLYDRVTNVGVGGYYVAVGDSITSGEGDDVTYDDTSQDQRNTGGGYEPVLNDNLTATTGHPNTVVNEGMPGATSYIGLQNIQGVLDRNPDARFFLIEFGTNDPGEYIPGGAGLQPGDTGYSGSFKDYMQQIITRIKNAGKEPCLAKVPYGVGSYSYRNSTYQEYNQAIDELVAANGIAVTPPDFYSYFQAHQDLYSDDLHPDGAGYRAMADLWHAALTK